MRPEVISGIWGGEASVGGQGAIQSPASRTPGGGSIAQLVECLPRVQEAISLFPRMTKKQVWRRMLVISALEEVEVGGSAT